MASTSLDHALAATNCGIVIADATEEGFPLTFVNGAFERLTGYSAADCLGRNCRFLQGPGTDPAAIAAVGEALGAGREVRNVLLNYRIDGSTFYNELRLAPVRDDDGRVLQIVGVQNDVTDIVRARRSLERDRDRIQTSLRRATEVIARKDQVLHELRVLQEALTPVQPPLRPHLELAVRFLPAEDGVAGDFHLVTPGPGDSTVIVVGDAMGHGLHAARRATFVRTALATFARFTDDPVRLLEMANHSLIERVGTTAGFVTALCATFEPASGRLLWAAAGHPAPLSLDTGESIGGQPAFGPPLGIDIDFDVGGATAHAELPPGRGLLLFTDGLTEARRISPRHLSAPRLGERRVRELLRSLGGRDPEGIVERLGAEVVAHTGGELADDLCLVALRAS